MYVYGFTCYAWVHILQSEPKQTNGVRNIVTLLNDVQVELSRIKHLHVSLVGLCSCQIKLAGKEPLKLIDWVAHPIVSEIILSTCLLDG